MKDFSQEIKDFLQRHYSDRDIDNMSLDELKKFKEELIHKRQEYALLENGTKILANAAYGACASPYFEFFNTALAGDITGECRELTKTMWKNLEEFFHETLWERKDLWEKFDFELDPAKKEWFSTQHVSVYSDTDSIDKDSVLYIKRNNKIETIFIDELYTQYCPGEIDKAKNIKPLDNIEVLNYKDGQLEFVPINWIMAHRVNKPKWKLQAKSGKEIIVTNDHSLVVFRDGKQIEIKAKDINISTDKVLSINNYNYSFDEIESVEHIGNFEDEVVYDIEVNDNSHTFIANDILVHNSVYTSYGSLFQAMTPEYQKKYESDKSKIDFILRFNKEFLDGQKNAWCEEIYNPRFGKSVHEFELETISKSQIILKKKKYLKGLIYNKGKILDKPKVSGTGIEIIKSTTPKLCREILSDLMKSLMFDYSEDRKDEFLLEFNEKLRNYRKQFYKSDLESISQSVGIGEYKKFVIDDKENLVLGKGCPVSVHAIARYNYLAYKNGDNDKIIYSGKIKYYNICLGVKGKNVETGYFGFPAGELPEWAPAMDKLVQWDKNVIKPINRFLEVMKLPLAKPVDNIQLSLF